jgi:hypothetical protein
VEPKRYVQPLRDLTQRRRNCILPLHVLVAVEVRRWAPDELDEQRELVRDLGLHCGDVCRVDELVPWDPLPLTPRCPLAEIEVQADSQARTSRGHRRSLRRSGLSHHEARTRHNPVIVRKHDSVID